MKCTPFQETVFKPQSQSKVCTKLLVKHAPTRKLFCKICECNFTSFRVSRPNHQAENRSLKPNRRWTQPKMYKSLLHSAGAILLTLGWDLKQLERVRFPYGSFLSTDTLIFAFPQSFPYHNITSLSRSVGPYQSYCVLQSTANLSLKMKQVLVFFCFIF